MRQGNKKSQKKERYKIKPIKDNNTEVQVITKLENID